MFSRLFGKAQSARKQRRDSARREQRRRSFLHMEHFERRDVPSGTAYIAAFTLHVDCTGGPDTVTIDHNGSSATVVIDSQTWSFPDNLYYAIAISGGTGGLTTNIRGNVQPLSLLGHHDMDTVKVGDLSN